MPALEIHEAGTNPRFKTLAIGGHCPSRADRILPLVEERMLNESIRRPVAHDCGVRSPTSYRIAPQDIPVPADALSRDGYPPRSGGLSEL
jgi:hypothetical protein